MVESSSWSDPQSALTMELGFGDVAAYVSDAPRRRCVVPKVRRRQLNGNDQRVPEYWDQTVPVWSCKETRISGSSRRKADSVCKHGESSPRFGDGNGVTMFLDNKLESCCCEDGRPEHSAHVDGAAAASEVSFDAILSMYQSALVENCFKQSRGDSWVVGAQLLLKRSRRRKSTRHDDERRLLRHFAGSCSKFSSGARAGHISVLTCCATRLGEVDAAISVRSLQAAGGYPGSSSNSHCGMSFPGVDYQNQLLFKSILP